MKQKTLLKLTLSLFLVPFSIATPVHSQVYPHAYPNDNYQMMNLPTQDLVHMGDPMNTPAQGFVLVDNGAGGSVAYGLPESQIRRTGVFYDESNGLPLARFPGIYLLGLEFAAGRFIAIDQNYGGVTFFAVPEAAGLTNLLLDIRGFKLEGRNWAASFGVGLRHFDKEFKKVYGVNVFYDYLDQHGAFNQVGLGFELLSKCWEFHINGYWPVGTLHHSLSKRVLRFKGDFVGVFQDNQNALRGVEMTAGGRWTFFDNLNFYIAPGLYIYNNKDLNKNVQGVQGIFEMNWNEWVSARVNVSYDRQFRGRVQGVIALNIPLTFNFYQNDRYGCNTCTDCCCDNSTDILGYRIRRNDLIFLKKCCSVDRNWDDCGRLTN